MNIINFILKLLGFTTDNSKTNNTFGVVNYAWMLPVMAWVWIHRAETVIFQIALNLKGKTEIITLFSTTYLGLSFVVIGVFIYIEINRRAP